MDDVRAEIESTIEDEEPGAPGVVGPRTPTEELVAALWCEVLELDVVDISDDFFEVGGHSMVAVQVVFELADRTGLPLELESFFELGTIEEIAAELDRLRMLRHVTAGPAVYEGEL